MEDNVRTRDEVVRELERTVEGLREEVQRMNLALESSEVGTWSLDVLEGICTWDDHCPVLFGLPPGSFRDGYQHWLDLVHPDDRPRVQDECTRCLEDITNYDTEYRVIWPDGSVHAIASRSTMGIPS